MKCAAWKGIVEFVQTLLSTPLVTKLTRLRRVLKSLREEGQGICAEWGLCEYIIVHTILPPSPAILWIDRAGWQAKMATIDWIPWRNLHRSIVVGKKRKEQQ